MILVNNSKTENFDVIDIEGSKPLQAGESHSFWHSHPWVSTDLLILMLTNLPPEKRGLTSHQLEEGLEVFHFPEDHEETIRLILNDLRKQEEAQRQKQETGAWS